MCRLSAVRRPQTLAALEAQIARDLMRAKRHTPGDGWHFLPAPAEVDWNGRYWLGMPRTSEGAVLAAVAKLCDAARARLHGDST